MSFVRRVAQWSIRELARIACVLALIGLAIMSASVIWPDPLVVIMAMTIGQLVSVAALGTYFLAVLDDVIRGTRPAVDASEIPPDSQEVPPSESDAED